MEDQTLAALRAEILSTATEDIFGLWEAWSIATDLAPELPLSSALALAEAAVAALLSEGLIELLSGDWTEQSAIPPMEIAGTMRALTSWIPGSDGPTIFYVATEAGDRAYFFPDGSAD